MSAATQPPEGVDSFLPLRDAVTQPDALSDSMNAPLGGAAARRRALRSPPRRAPDVIGARPNATDRV